MDIWRKLKRIIMVWFTQKNRHIAQNWILISNSNWTFSKFYLLIYIYITNSIFFFWKLSSFIFFICFFLLLLLFFWFLDYHSWSLLYYNLVFYYYVYFMTLVFMLCFRVSFINNSFDHYSFIIGGVLKNKNIRVQILEANDFLFQFLKFCP